MSRSNHVEGEILSQYQLWQRGLARVEQLVPADWPRSKEIVDIFLTFLVS